MRQLTSQLEVERLAAANAIEQLEQEQCDKRELQEQLNDLKLRKNNYQYVFHSRNIIHTYY